MPASTAYAFTLFVTWWTLRGVDDALGMHIILSASTNLHNMRDDPIQVLVASAFWIDGGFPWLTIIEFLTVMAFAERWLGTLRWILVFAAGHIGATLITVADIVQPADAQASDVGPSYGMIAIGAAMTYWLRGWFRWVWVLGMACVLGYLAWKGQTFTDYGHVIAMVIGLLVGPLARWSRDRGDGDKPRTTPAGGGTRQPGGAGSRAAVGGDSAGTAVGELPLG